MINGVFWDGFKMMFKKKLVWNSGLMSLSFFLTLLNQYILCLAWVYVVSVL